MRSPSLMLSAVVLAAATPAQSGPCTEQIAQLEQQIANVAPGPQTGPTAPQTKDAQLHHQPTPGSIRQAEGTANKDADDALDRAKKADAAGSATECNAALQNVRELYGFR